LDKEKGGEVMEEFIAFVVALFVGALFGILMYAAFALPPQVEAGYGYRWKCSGNMVAKVGDVYYDVKPCERVKKETK
jgi:hypothetical protein